MLKRKGQKRKLLRKLTINKEETEIERMQEILKGHNLEMMMLPGQDFDLFQAISFYAFGNSNQGNKLRTICFNYVYDYIEKGKFKGDMKFLKDNKLFLDIYKRKIGHHCFEGFNMTILSHLIKRSIHVYGQVETNNLPTVAVYNFMLSPAIPILVIQNASKLNYYPLKPSYFDPDGNDFVNYNKNIKRLKKHIENNYKSQVEFEFTVGDREANEGFKMIRDELVSKFRCIGHYKLFHNWNLREEDTVNSTAKEFKSIMENYQKSARKITNNKPYFYETITLENLDVENKKEIIFGKQVEGETKISKPNKVITKSVKEPVYSVSKSSGKKINMFTFDQDPNTNRSHVIMDKSKRMKGKIVKYFKAKQYGFIKVDGEKGELFFHLDEASKAGLTQDFIDKNKPIFISFSIQEYLNNYSTKRKAVDLKIVVNEMGLAEKGPVVDIDSDQNDF